MKRVIFSMMFLMLSVIGFSQGINFEKLTYQEAIAKAKAEKKLVFVDAYTQWCGPCKQMANVEFVKKEAGDFFNANFVNVKFDMESEEGKELNKILNVKAYPTFFIIRSDGKIQHIVTGGQDITSFIAEIKKGMDRKTSLLYLKEDYANGKLNKEGLITLFQVANRAKETDLAEKVKAEIMAGVSDKEKTTKMYWPIMTERKQAYYDTENFNFILANVSDFKKNMGEEIMENYFHSIYTKWLRYYIHGNYGGGANSLDKAMTAKVREQLAVVKLNDKHEKEVRVKCDFADARRDANVTLMIEILKENHDLFIEDNYWSIASSFIMAAKDKKLTEAEKKGIHELGDIFAAKVSDNMKVETKSYFTRF